MAHKNLKLLENNGASVSSSFAHRMLPEELWGLEGVQRPAPRPHTHQSFNQNLLFLSETKQLLFHTHILLGLIQLPSTTLFKMKMLSLLRTV